MTANPNPTYDTLLDFWRAVRDADQECAELIEFNEAVGEALAAVGASMLHAKPIEQPLPAPPEPPRCPACGLTVGSVHTARPNWMAGREPKWFVDIPNKCCDSTTFPVGIRSDEAEEVAE